MVNVNFLNNLNYNTIRHTKRCCAFNKTGNVCMHREDIIV